jgi:hypothetical protein
MIMLEELTTFDYIIGCAQIVGSLATAGAFIVTYRTLKEMKRQTDLDNDPVLKIHFRSYDKKGFEEIVSSGNSIKWDFSPISAPYTSWQTIIHNNLKQDLSSLKDQYIVLELCNCGKSEISLINFKITLTIKMFESDLIPISFKPTIYSKEFSIPVELNENNSIFFRIANAKYFPIYSCELTNINYLDIHKKKYVDFIGDLSVNESNENLRPIAEEMVPF